MCFYVYSIWRYWVGIYVSGVIIVQRFNFNEARYKCYVHKLNICIYKVYVFPLQWALSLKIFLLNC